MAPVGSVLAVIKAIVVGQTLGLVGDTLGLLDLAIGAWLGGLGPTAGQNQEISFEVAGLRFDGGPLPGRPVTLLPHRFFPLQARRLGLVFGL